jgi:hypothetical protein
MRRNLDSSIPYAVADASYLIKPSATDRTGCWVATKRQSRNRRTTALTCGLMAEVALGSVVLIWSDSPGSAAQAVLGRGGSIGITLIGMVALAAAMLILLVAERLSRSLLLATVVVFTLVSACVGVLAIATFATDPGVGFLLSFGWVLTFPVGLNVRRTNGSSANQKDLTRRIG